MPTTESLLRHLASRIAGRVKRGSISLDVRADYGAKGNNITDDTAAIQAAINDAPAGGRVHLPAATYYCAGPLTIDKPVMISGQGSPGFQTVRGTTIRFPSGSQGFQISGTSGPSVIRRLYLLGAASGPSAAHGIKVANGVAYLTELFVDGFAGHGIFFDGTAGGNAHNGRVANSFIRRCKQDGIHIEGSSAQAIQLDRVDATANLGWGVNLESSHNWVQSVHVGDLAPGALGALRDNATSNIWMHPYAELNGKMQFGTNSTNGIVFTSIYGRPSFEFLGSARPLILSPDQGFAFLSRITGNTTSSSLRQDFYSANTSAFFSGLLDDEKMVWAHYPTTNILRFNSHVRAVADNTYDFGSSTERFRDLFASRHLRLGSLYLRDNAGVLEKSTNGTTWTAV